MKSPPLPGGLPPAGLFRGVLAALALAVGISLFLLWWEVPPEGVWSAAPRPPATEEVAPAEEASVTPQPSPTPSGPRHYTVKEGDTLLAIAIKYGVTVEALAQANDLKEPYPMKIGQELVVPEAIEASPTPTSTVAPTPAATASPAAASPTPASGPQRYTVQEGDTLLAIAIKYGVTVEALAQANDLKEPYALQIGQELVIPSGQ